MAEEQEKDYFWFYIGGLIVATIVLVLMLKADETKHLASGVVAEQQKETFTKIEKRHTSNNSSAEAISGK
ncbi:MAG: hypothetical protein Q8N35_07845 [Methylococcaceae bacterium]|jgi:uncharacterized membrane protein|nr:hypothetical protein [Methylococcaceae bacterium]MDP2394957.1 hypothetical protein [Methylococcaceae bacterium]MDP3019483.1 hypothetical protein [Methylococcaceae bacterium]MDP3389473.1 hypothetical protein [Methylococcaceae bacterium]MDP3932010.1 hypothetical protein [Methylococcaceae bacterium]